MQIFIGSDHAGYTHKQAIMDHLEGKEISVLDLGVFTDVNKVDYPDVAREVGEKVLENGEGNYGILVCGTGMGMALAANKLRGIRAVTAHDENTATMAKQHNNANVLTLGERVVPEAEALKIVDAFLSAEFEGGRHEARLEKIKAIEDEQ